MTEVKVFYFNWIELCDRCFMTHWFPRWDTHRKLLNKRDGTNTLILEFPMRKSISYLKILFKNEIPIEIQKLCR